jgi:hypothetical protein
MSKEVFVPVTMKVEPSELSTIEMIARVGKRSSFDACTRWSSWG